MSAELKTAAVAQRDPVATAIATFSIFVAAGPPLGFLVLFGGEAVLSIKRLLTAHEMNLLLNGFAMLSWFSYLFGGVQAVVVGLVAAVAQYRGRNPHIPFVPVVFAGVMVGAAVLALLFITTEKSTTTAGQAAAMIGIHLGAAIGCWLLATLLQWPLRRSDTAGAT